MSIAVELWVMGHWCRVGLHPFNWIVAFQFAPDGPSNIRLGPFQMCWN